MVRASLPVDRTTVCPGRGKEMLSVGRVNGRGCDEVGKKRNEIDRMFEMKLYVVGLSETKLRGEGEMRLEESARGWGGGHK